MLMKVIECFSWFRGLLENSFSAETSETGAKFTRGRGSPFIPTDRSVNELISVAGYTTWIAV